MTFVQCHSTSDVKNISYFTQTVTVHQIVGHLLNTVVCLSQCIKTASVSTVMLQVSVHMVTDEGIDWWSKYHASIGQEDKCKHYLELGYDKIQACNQFL